MMEPPAGKLRLPLAVLLSVIAVGAAVDLVLDRPRSLLTFHALYELALALGSAAIATWLWAGWRRAEQEGARLRRSLQERQAERDRWRASAEQALTGLASAIQRQFEEWGFTEAEREVAMQLLRGLSHKEIAAATGRSDRTVRQHAAAAYQKAGLDGRASLAAFFLEGLIPPASARPALTPEALSGGGLPRDT